MVRVATVVLAAVVVVAAIGAAIAFGLREWDVETAVRDPGPPHRDVAVRLRWEARVTDSTWDGVPVDASCFLGAGLHSDSEQLIAAHLGLACGGKLIEQTSTEAGHLACDALERPGLGMGNYEYDVVCRTREGTSANVTWRFDTRGRRLVLVRSQPAARLSFEVRREDGVARGQTLYARSFGRLRFRGPLRYRGRVSASEGVLPFELPPSCDVSVLPTPLSDSPCRVVVECSGKMLYGGFDMGFVTCAIGEGGPTVLSDGGSTPEDGDPRLQMNLSTLQAEVADETGWKVRFALEKK